MTQKIDGAGLSRPLEGVATPATGSARFTPCAHTG